MPLASIDLRRSAGDAIGSPAAVTNRARKYVAGDSRITGSFTVRDGGTVMLKRYGANPGAATTTW